jgi:hypothetical protein
VRVLVIAIAACALLNVESRATALAAIAGERGPWVTIAVSAAPLNAHKQAPADEYFGEQRLSVLGIRSIIAAMNIEGTSPLALPMQLERIEGVRSAFAEMIERYPDEGWLPSEMLAFAKFLMSKRQPFADALAAGYLRYVSMRFPASAEGKTAATLLATYNLLPFDMSEAPMPDPHDGVPAYLFPPLHPRR